MMFVKVKVFPKANEEKIFQKSKDSFEIKIKEKPEQGAANKRTKEVLAGFFNINSQKIRIIKGARQRNKIFEIPD